jgi:hypothetical protein
VRPKAPRYGDLVTTVTLGERGLMPHHTEYQLPIGHPVFANGWAAGRTFLLDLANPRKPRIVSRFAKRGGWTYPHSFARLPNGHVLATFQSRGDSYGPPGGLVELDANGRFLRGTSASAPGVDDRLLWPYGVLALPDIDRVVTTSTPMGMPKWSTTHQHGDGATRTRHVQVWRLSDLELLSTIALPAEGVDSGVAFGAAATRGWFRVCHHVQLRALSADRTRDEFTARRLRPRVPGSIPPAGAAGSSASCLV